jgi:hypothetical protein
VEECDADIYAVSYEKSKLDLETPKNKKEHNLIHTLELITLILMNDDGMTYDIILDSTSLMNGYEDIFVKMCNNLAESHGKRVENIEMRDSRGTKILQVQDYISGAVWAHIEYENDIEDHCHHRFGIIERKIKRIIKK